MFKDYKNIKDTKELEMFLIELLEDNSLSKEWRAEINKVLKEVQKINFLKLFTKEEKAEINKIFKKINK